MKKFILPGKQQFQKLKHNYKFYKQTFYNFKFSYKLNKISIDIERENKRNIYIFIIFLCKRNFFILIKES